MADISKKPDTCREASSVTSSVSQEKTVPLQRRGKDIIFHSLGPLIRLPTND